MHVQTLNLGPVVVDFDALLVRSPAGEQVLSPLEGQLLAYLLSHRGKTVGRSKLLEEVWGYSPRVVSRAVDHAVARLRRKIEHDPANPQWLTSIRGAGYRLEEPRAVGEPSIPEDRDLFGRDDLLSRLAAEWRAQARLVTLHGPPGVGKTRLCMEHLARLHRSDDAVQTAFVPLFDTQGRAAIVERVAQVLDVRPPTEEPEGWLGRVLQLRGPLVLALDNVEHVASEVAQLVRGWLQAAPELRVLTTSRQPLHLPAEARCAVGPLRREDAVALMVARARQVRRGFAPRPSELQTLARLAEDQLDGLPLALELAAARLRVLDVDELARRIGDRFALLRGDDTDSNWSSLASALTWSWDLLEPDERSALRSCAVFRGGFDLAAAEAVIGRGDPSPLDLLSQLVDHALVQRVESSTSARFRVLASVRAFVEQVHPPHTAERRHARHFAAWAEPRVPGIVGPQQAEVVTQLLTEEENLRTAHAWTLQHDHPRAATLARALADMWNHDGRPTTALGPLRATLSRLEPGTAPWVRLRVTLARALQATCAHHESVALLKEAEPHAGTAELRALVELGLGNAYNDLGETERARESLEAARELAHAAGRPAEEGVACQILAHLESGRGSVERGEALALRGEEIADTIGFDALRVGCLHVRASCLLHRDDPAGALGLATRALELSRRVGLNRFTMVLEARCGYALLSLGRPAPAREMAASVVAEAERTGQFDVAYQARLLESLTLVDLRRPDEADRVLDRLAADPDPAPVYSTGMLALRRAMAAAADGRDADTERWAGQALDELRSGPGGYALTFGQAAVLLAATLARRGEVAGIEPLVAETHERMASRAAEERDGVAGMLEVHRLAARERQLRLEAEAIAEARQRAIDELQAAPTQLVTRLLDLTDPRHQG